MQLLGSRALSSNTLISTLLILTLLALGGQQSEAVCFLILRLKREVRYQNTGTYSHAAPTHVGLHNCRNKSL